MRNYNCCVCGHVMEEKEMGLEFVRITQAVVPLYRKLYAYFCSACNCFRQVEDEATRL